MNAKQLFAAIAVFAVAGSAFADSGVVLSKTRAEVMAELQQAQADGTYVVGGSEFVNQNIATHYRPSAKESTTVAAGKTRAEVIAELKQAQAEGKYVVGGSELQDAMPIVARRARSEAEAIESVQTKKAAGATGS